MNSDLQDNSFNNYPHNEILSYKWTNCLFTEAINQNKEVNFVLCSSLSLPSWLAQLVYKLISKYVLLVGIGDLSRCKVIAIFGLQRWGCEFVTTLKAIKALEPRTILEKYIWNFLRDSMEVKGCFRVCLT